jgi:hypothetical protein
LKLSLAIVLSILISTCSWGQTNTDFEEAIARIINTGLLEGHDQKVIGGKGDTAAVIVTKVVGDRKLTTSQADIILIVLNSAFGGIQAGPDREPRTALFVLRYLESSTQDPGLLQRIEKTRKYIQTQPSAATKTPASAPLIRSGVGTADGR